MSRTGRFNAPPRGPPARSGTGYDACSRAPPTDGHSVDSRAFRRRIAHSFTPLMIPHPASGTAVPLALETHPHAVPQARAAGRLAHLHAVAADAFLCGAVLMVVQVYFKYTYLHFGGLEILGRASELGGTTAAHLAPFFAADILESLVVLPIVLLVVGWGLSARARILTFVGILFLLVLGGVAAWQTYHTIGKFPSLALIQDYREAYRNGPDFVALGSVLGFRQLAKAALIVALAFVPLILLSSRARRANGMLVRGWVLPLVFIVPALIVWVAIGEDRTVYHAAHINRITTEFSRRDNVTIPKYVTHTPAELRAMYDSLAYPGWGGDRAPAVMAARHTAAPKPNVLLIVLETAAAQDYDFTDTAGVLPNVARLARRGVVARQHYSSYPYSIRANFTVLSSIYDLPSKHMMIDHLGDSGTANLDALPRVLARSGYATHYYYPVPVTLGDRERRMLRSLGFSSVFEGVKEGPRRGGALRRAEIAMFARVRDDIAADVRAGQPFFAAVVSAVGHGPYPDVRIAAIREADPRPSRTTLINAIARMLDAEIGATISHLARIGALDNTIIVITGDHGVRSKADDPTIDLRVVNRSSFHVPLVVHYPAGLPTPGTVDCVTSHIDVTPTILDLAGIDRTGLLHQGLPLSEVCGRDRVTFMLGGHYIGSNGVHREGAYFMRNEVTRLAFLSDRFEFSSTDRIAPERSPTASDLDARLTDLTRVQLAWAAYVRSRGKEAAITAAPPATAISVAPGRTDPGETALNHSGAIPRKENRQ